MGMGGGRHVIGGRGVGVRRGTGASRGRVVTGGVLSGHCVIGL